MRLFRDGGLPSVITATPIHQTIYSVSLIKMLPMVQHPFSKRFIRMSSVMLCQKSPLLIQTRIDFLKALVFKENLFLLPGGVSLSLCQIREHFCRILRRVTLNAVIAVLGNRGKAFHGNLILHSVSASNAIDMAVYILTDVSPNSARADLLKISSLFH